MLIELRGKFFLDNRLSLDLLYCIDGGILLFIWNCKLMLFIINFFFQIFYMFVDEKDIKYFELGYVYIIGG